jgi:4-amino-4-deoxy-L-arabinose transferase-like glycosyltransferase
MELPMSGRAGVSAGASAWRVVDLAVPMLAVAYMLGLRLWYDLAAPPMGDEAYYWMWGQRLDWSYLDHPPLGAWLQGLSAAIFGWSTLSMRAMTWVSLGGTLGVIWAFSREIEVLDRALFFWRTSAVFLTVPVIAYFSLWAYLDHWLIFFSLASLYFFWRFARAWQSGRGGVGSLYLAAIALGLATLSKYNGALLGLGYVAYLAWRRPLWSVLRAPHPYLAALLAAAIQAPVIYWNVQARFASVAFHFVERGSNSHWGTVDWSLVQGFLQGVALMALGPFLVIGLIVLIWRKEKPDAVSGGLSLSIFTASTLVVGVVSMFTVVLLHWNIEGYIALGFIGYWLLSSRWLLWPHLALVLYLLTGSVANYTTATTPIPGFVDPGALTTFGWTEVAAAIDKAREAHKTDFIGTTVYQYSAQLGFVTHTTNITAFSPVPSEYDRLWNPDAHLGQNAIVVADKRNPIAYTTRLFAAATKVADVPVVVSGKQVWTYELYWAEGYKGASP